MKHVLISIGYGRQLFEKENIERQRLVRCASSLHAVHHIVFTTGKDACVQASEGNLTLYPTASRHRLSMVFDAIVIACSLINKKDTACTWTITSQDPLWTGLVGFVVSRIRRLPFVVQEHGDIFSKGYWRAESFQNRCWYPIARFLVRRADRVRAVSKRVAHNLCAVGVEGARITILPVYSDISEWEVRTPVQSLKEKYPEASPIVLSVLRFVPQKNGALLLHAFARLCAHMPQAKLVLVGSGKEQEMYERMIRALGIDTSVVLVPWSDDVMSLMKTADIYALSSNYEGWGRVLLEAMACALPVVTTDVGCVGEVFFDRKHGRVVPVGSIDAFSDALIELARNPGVRQEYGTHAHFDVAKVFSDFETYTRMWSRVFVVSESQ